MSTIDDLFPYAIIAFIMIVLILWELSDIKQRLDTIIKQNKEMVE